VVPDIWVDVRWDCEVDGHDGDFEATRLLLLLTGSLDTRKLVVRSELSLLKKIVEKERKSKAAAYGRQ
jgi:hypothetical protein